MSRLFLRRMVIQANSSECLVPGDPDVIGLGFRLGFYFQLLSTLLLGIVRPEEAADAFIPNLFFIIGLICAAIYSSARLNYPPGSVIACTWYPVLAYVALLPLFYSHLPAKLPWYRVMMYPAVVIATCCFAIWFWFSGLDAVHPSQCMDPRVFLFYNLDAKGRVRIVFKISTILSLIIAIISGGGAILFQSISLSILPSTDLPRLCHNRTDPGREVELPDSSLSDGSRSAQPTKGATASSATDSSQGGATGQNKPPTHPGQARSPSSTEVLHTKHRFRIPVLGSIFLIWGITASELQLKWNHVVGINSINTSGQVLPLVLGTLSLLYTFFALRNEMWKAMTRLWLNIKKFGRAMLEVFWKFIIWTFGKVRRGWRALSKCLKKPRRPSTGSGC